MLEKSKIINITLEGSEQKISDLSGYYAEITNHTGSIIYASTKPGIKPGSKNVMTILSGRKGIIAFPFNSKDLYLLGEGSIHILGTDYPTDSFVPSNPNLLINPDFRINQRGMAEYSGPGYAIDGWMLFSSAVTIATRNDGLHCALKEDTDATGITVLLQYCELDISSLSGYITISAKIAGLQITDGHILIRARFGDVNKTYLGAASIMLSPSDTAGVYSATMEIPQGAVNVHCDITSHNCKAGNNMNISWIKLETGGVATEHIAPDRSTELIKCQRYYQIRSTDNINPVDLRPNMRTTPTVTQLDDGNYAYSAEL